jgi:hypothetical protein
MNYFILDSSHAAICIHSEGRGAELIPNGNKEHWFQLCELAVVEQDPAKLLMLVQEICLLLKEKETWLKRSVHGPTK